MFTQTSCLFRTVILTQVACGPHHMAAVVASGRLYTWGDGFAGKLGHGDRGGCAEPRVVEGLRHLQVRRPPPG